MECIGVARVTMIFIIVATKRNFRRCIRLAEKRTKNKMSNLGWKLVAFHLDQSFWNRLRPYQYPNIHCI